MVPLYPSHDILRIFLLDKYSNQIRHVHLIYKGYVYKAMCIILRQRSTNNSRTCTCLRLNECNVRTDLPLYISYIVRIIVIQGYPNITIKQGLEMKRKQINKRHLATQCIVTCINNLKEVINVCEFNVRSKTTYMSYHKELGHSMRMREVIGIEQ